MKNVSSDSKKVYFFRIRTDLLTLNYSADVFVLLSPFAKFFTPKLNSKKVHLLEIVREWGVLAMAEKQVQNQNSSQNRTTQYTVIKVRLHPTAEQAELIEKTFGCCRYLWNRMLADVQEFYAATDIHYIPTPARYKKEAPFLTEVDSQPLCTVHQNLRRAFLDFFRNPGAFRYPQFKTKKARKDAFTVYCRPYRTGPSIYLTRDGIKMPKLGNVKATLYRRPLHWWSLRFVTVTKTRSGKYFCSLTYGCDVRRPQPIAPAPERTVGLHHSVASFYVDSEGRSPVLPQLAKSKEKLARMQQKLSRMQRGSKNYEEQLQKIRLLHEHIANQRRDFLHKESGRIANACDAVCVRDTDLTELAKKLKGSDVFGAGFGAFREYLQYKLERQGKPYIVVDRLLPVAKICHECGAVNETLPARRKTWQCPHCGALLNREANAARNLKQQGLAQLGA